MIHKPKTYNTKDGLGLPNTTRHIKEISTDEIILTQIWQEMSEDWKQDNVIIARPGYKWVSKWQVGKPYIFVKFYDDQDQLIGIYCDVCYPVNRIKDGLEFQDLYLDVWWVVGSAKPMVLDEDELKQAFKAGYITQKDVDSAYSVAKDLLNKIENNDSEIQF